MLKIRKGWYVKTRNMDCFIETNRKYRTSKFISTILRKTGKKNVHIDDIEDIKNRMEKATMLEYHYEESFGARCFIKTFGKIIEVSCPYYMSV